MRIFTLPTFHFLSIFFVTASLWAGSYSQDFSGQSSGSTDLGDGSEISSNNGVAQVQGSENPYFRLTSNSFGGTSSSFKLPDLDPGETVESFTASFQLQVGGSAPFADGASLTFGAIPAGDGSGEAGFPVDKSLVIAWDTYANGNEVPSIEIFSGGVSVLNQPFNFGGVANRFVSVVLTWDEGGLDLNFDGVAIATDLSLPGFVPVSGDRFAFSGRTGGATQNTYLDDLVFETALASNIETGGPVITEFVADNGESFEDDELDEPDWIEIYNGQGTGVNLDGYFLTVDPTGASKWRLPAVTLDPYEHLVVFASAKDRFEVEKTLHTNFTLQKSGGYLALVEPDGVTIRSEFQYGAQVEDIAYGELGESRTVGFLETPTPGTRNSGLQGDGPPAEGVEFDRNGGVFSGSTNLGILPPTSDSAIVRYTTDGSVPTESSPIYTSAFSITATSTIRARAFEPGRLPGELKSRTLLKLSSDLNNFSSNLPIVIIDSNGIDIDAANNPVNPRPFRDVYTVVIDRSEGDGQARLDDVPDFTGRGAMHVRGQSSSGFPKKQYSWETRNNEGGDKDVSLLGMPSESDWVLQAPYSDKTLMRNALVYGASRDLNGNAGGVRTRYVEVFFNQRGGSISEADYRGVYVLMERIKRDEQRIDVEKLNDLVTDPDLISGGYIFKKDKPPYSKSWRTGVEKIPLDMQYPESPNDAQFKYLTEYVDEMESTLHSTNFKDPDSGYAAFLDVTSFIDAHLFVETFKNIDGYRISTYFTKPRAGKIRALPVWDYNLALGNADYLEGEEPQGWYYTQTSSQDYYWYRRLFLDKEFELAYWDRFWELRHGLFSTPEFLVRIDRQTEELGSGGVPNALSRNFEKWDILGEYRWPNAAGWGQRTTHQAEVEWMKNWFTDRLDWIETQSRGTNGQARPPVLGQYGGDVAEGFALTMSEPNGWPGGEIYYTLDGSDPRVSQSSEVTLISDGAPCEVLVPTIENGGSTLEVLEWTTLTVPPNAGAWLTGRQGVGYERNTGNPYDPLFNIDIEAEMAGVNRSCYIRIPFTISSQAEIDRLTEMTLKMRYDDSFVAYLNGVEIVREANAPAVLTYDSGAEDGHDDDEAVEYLDFPVTSGLAELRVGRNLLAIHGLNDNILSSDALWSCLLKGGTGTANSPAPGALVYSQALTLNRSTEVKARVYNGFKWSPLSTGAFFVDTLPASAGNLVISELNYRPAEANEEEIAAGFTSRGDFEYLELMNIDTTRSISLEGLSFTDGVTFAGFDSSLPVDALVLPPGGRVVVVSNEAAFRFRYSNSEAIVTGEFSGSLRNEGEQVALLDAAGEVIKSFVYSSEFPWPEASGDGRGYSLVLLDALDNPNHNDPLNWRSSVSIGGTPGGDDTIPFSGDPQADLDGDGLSALVEYAIGSSDADASDRSELHVSVGEFLFVTLPVNLAATGFEISLESSDDLLGWSAIEDLTHISTSNEGNGIATRTYQSLLPVGEGDRRKFFRLRVAARF